MTRIRVELSYSTYGQVFVNLPESMEVDDIDELYVKWPDTIDYYEDNDEY
jgi:hypothetical protein